VNVLNIPQRSPEWIKARTGSLGASRIHEIMARTKTGYSTSRANLMAELITERLTGLPYVSWQNMAMQWGTDNEALARRAYVFEHEVEVAEVGMVLHPRLANTHASPDGFVTLKDGEVGLLEIKCPYQTAVHLVALRNGEIRGEYFTQMQWQMACTGLGWCDFVSFDPRLPEPIQLFVKRFERQDTYIENLETEATLFLEELDTAVEDLRRRYNLEKPT
jgi:putative phage-type endonuclease